MARYRAWVLSPVAPALLLVFGLVFGFAFAHLAGMEWSTTATRLYYLGLLAWGGIVLVSRWQKRGALRPGDCIFAAWVLLLAVSLAAYRESSPSAAYFAQLLPFLVLLPYMLGRLVEASDFSFIVHALPRLGFLLLLLCGADFWLVPNPDEVLERWIFFGLNHTPLLIAQVLSVATLVQVFIILTPDRARPLGWEWAGLGVLTIASVMIAARGSLITTALTMLVLLILLPGQWRRKAALILYLGAAAALAFKLLPAQQSELYSRLKTIASTTAVEAAVPHAQSSVVNGVPVALQTDPRCQPLVLGFNSVAIRRVLYQEAVDLSVQHPFAGVGASNFGKYSCGGEKSYPHSTVLQAFAELGLFGGGLLVALVVVSLLVFWRAHASSVRAATDATLWFVLLLFFTLTDQIYGNYFMAAGSFFLFGVAARYQLPLRSGSC
jgi:O-antigen ligase